MFDFVFGLINFVFKLIGIIGFDWVNNLIWGFVVFNIIEVWLVYLFMMIVIIVVFQLVLDMLIEVVIIDGVNYWQRIWNVVVLIVGKLIVFVIIFMSVVSFQYFMVLYIYNVGFFEDRFFLFYGFRKVFGVSLYYGRVVVIMVIVMFILVVYMYVNVRIIRFQEGVRG